PRRVAPSRSTHRQVYHSCYALLSHASPPLQYAAYRLLSEQAARMGEEADPSTLPSCLPPPLLRDVERHLEGRQGADASHVRCGRSPLNAAPFHPPAKPTHPQVV